MPELPEVEVVRAGLERHVVGRQIVAVQVLHDRPVRQHLGGGKEFAKDLEGSVIESARRRGKYLWLVLGRDALLVHLGMSGQFRLAAPDDPLLRHTRVRMLLSCGTDLRFVDQRMFGGLELKRDAAEDPVPHIAPDPFSPDFDLAYVARPLRLRHSAVKRVLLDQRLVSGIGKIQNHKQTPLCSAAGYTTRFHAPARRSCEVLDARVA